MGITSRLAVGMLALWLVASVGHAEDGGQVRRPGTFLMAEGELGYGLGGAFAENPDGLATGFTFGAGGKPKGWPLRFFGIARFAWASLEGAVDRGFERAVIARDVFNWSLGLRVIAPIAGRLRLVVDTTLGASSVESTATLAGGAERIASNDGSFLVDLGVGLQYRLHYNFSIGVRTDIAIPTGLEAFDALAEAAGANTSDGGVANLDWTLNATLHF